MKKPACKNPRLDTKCRRRLGVKAPKVNSDLIKCLALMLLFSCNSPERREQNQVRQTEKDLRMVQKEDSSSYFKELQQFKKTAKGRLNDNQVRLDKIQNAHVEKGKELKPRSRKTLADTQLQIALLLKRLDEFNEEGKDNAEKFMRDFQKDMNDLDTSIQSIEK